ncbi:malate synthase G, partial [Mesorhizobium sp. M4B.F.Ca.ET.088.02.2.1]
METAGLQIARELHDFVAAEAAPGTGIEPEQFWNGFSAIVHELAPKNRALLAKRDALQEKLDGWYRENGAPIDMEGYKSFLKEIGYLVPEGPAFSVSTQNVDPEIAVVAGPQLVVPVMNARYALNAANARWGSLYDALYGTDAIPETGGAEKGKGFNPARGAKVIAWAKDFLDQSAPLTSGKWAGVNGLSFTNGMLRLGEGAGSTTLADPRQFVGYRGDAANPEAVLLVRNGLHIEIR